MTAEASASERNGEASEESDATGGSGRQASPAATRAAAEPSPGGAPEPEGSNRRREVRFEYTAEFPRVLDRLHAALLISTYQAGKLCVVGVRDGRLTFSFHNLERVMGVAASPLRVAVGARRQIYSFHPAHDVASRLAPSGTFDACWIARTSFVTGNIHSHDLAWGQDGLWVVNTLFSCLCTLHENYSFVPRWRPPFISELIDQDRCHLNGLAMDEGRPRFVTVMAESNEPAGWRPTKATGGCVLDVPSGQTVARGFSMPHSPRWHDGRLWVLDSGKGLLTVVDPASGHVEPVTGMPGYTRGLAFGGPFAFVGLSRIRETSVFGGVPIAEHREELKCGVGVVDLRSGRQVAALQFHSGVEEIFAVELLPGAVHPHLCGVTLDEDEAQDVWIVPPAEPGPAAQPGPPRTAAQAVVAAALPGPSATQRATPQAAALGLSREGEALHGQGRLLEALDRLRRAAELDPASATVMNQLGNLQQDLGDQTAALSYYRRAVALQPDFAPAHQNLGVLATVLSEPHLALRHFELAQQVRPEAMNLVLGATVVPVIYDSAEDVRSWRRRLVDRVRALVDAGVAIDTANARIDTSFYFAYQGENDREVMLDLARVYRGVACCPAARDGLWRPRGPRLRVGFLSAHFRDHTIGRLNLGRVQRLARSRFEVTVISLRPPADAVAQAFQQAADRFVLVPRDPAAARRAIAELGLDILVFADVGMDTLTQTLAYSRMAPIQCVTWGHPDTTGSPVMDYFVSSRLLETDEADGHYSEQLVRLPNLGVYYARPALSGVPRNREFFGLDPTRHVYLCPQTLFKFHPEYDDVLRGILEADPLGDLVVPEGRVPAWTARLCQRWARTLPAAGRRVRFVPAQPNADFLHLLAQADVMLDPFPFGGGNTTYEALAVGTPVVTKPGRFLRGRIAGALYQRMGLDSAVAVTDEQYVSLAVRLATDGDFRRTVQREIADTCPVLFENDRDVTAWDEFLHEVTERKGV